MSSQDPSEAKTKTMRPNVGTVAAAFAKLKPPGAVSNYPPKVPFKDSALPNSHRPTSA